jgi:hypothetical protein
MTEIIPIDGSKPSIPKAPKGLKAEGRRLWRQLHMSYDFSDCPEKVIILERDCRTADVIARLQAVVDESQDLRTLGSQKQLVAIPEVPELRQYSALLNTLLKSLMLPVEEEPARGGLTRSQIGRLGAQARWSGVSR